MTFTANKTLLKLSVTHVFLAALAVFVFAPIVNAQDQIWLKQFGTAENDFASDLASDGTGGVYLCGHTTGDLGGPNAGPTWTNDAILARYNSAGERLWIKQFGTIHNERAIAVAPDDAKGVFVTGTTGAQTSTEWDIYLARYGETGERLWSIEFGSPVFEYVAGLASDGQGGTFICGRTQGNIAGTNAGGLDGFVGRFDDEGQQVWMAQFGGSDHDWAHSVTPDGQGGVYVAGMTGSPPLGPTTAFIARFDSFGRQVWFKSFGDGEQTTAIAITLDPNGGAYVAGVTDGDLGRPNLGEFDAYVARFDDLGNVRWISQFGTPKVDGAYTLVDDGQDGVIAGGRIDTLVGGLLDPIFGDAFVVSIASDGSHRWLSRFGTRLDEAVFSLSLDGQGGVFAIGDTNGFLGAPRAGEYDIFLARYTLEACYPDCDKSTGIGVLDIFDFLCFQESFVNGGPFGYACSCDDDPGPGVCDIFDFLCFQNAFVSGCP